ncbi:nucleotidyltransferase (plasmid) [Mucilaginibacter robiniae]|uniref:Nucleotidyltransferase n=1 Tax=Mucilaginibacter robiniae TaxID=2728022 RepID=A0A7L5E9S5_9SPHI|nr:nucleotidyltransferase [Mucilaginibacter robiniae]QJD98574.1 nucleotidyltransferase [Mucilaginibacter robiniae]
MAIETSFETFFNNLIVDNEESIFQKIKRIVKTLNKNLYNSESDTDHSYIIGSFGRNTAIKGVSDLDVIFALPEDLYYTYDARSGNGQSALLQKVKDIILTTYPQTDVRGDGQVVVIQFIGFKIELCPAFLEEGNTFTYPDANNGGCWKTVKPLQENEACDELNTLSEETYIKLCRLVRAWKNKFGLKISGLLIDTWCYDFLSANIEYHQEGLTHFPELIKDLFNYMTTFSPDRRYWYSPGSRQKVYKKSNINKKVKKSLEIATEAIECLEEDDKCGKYRSLFGKAFPYKNLVLEKAHNVRNNEEFIEDKFQLDIIYNLRIDCEVSQAGFRTVLLRNLKIIKSRMSLTFFVADCDAPKPYEVYWKIKNVGQHAIEKDMIRGQIIKDAGQGRRKESSTFNGPHYVECYIIKDGICVARDRINVPIRL